MSNTFKTTTTVETTSQKVNIAPTSDQGHFIMKNGEACTVIDLDVEKTEAFFVKGAHKVVTQNHTTVINNNSKFVTTQFTTNPITKALQKVVD